MPTLLKLCTVLIVLYLGNLECYTGDQELFFWHTWGVSWCSKQSLSVCFCCVVWVFFILFTILLRITSLNLVIALVHNTKKLPIPWTLLLAAWAGHCNSE